MKPRERFLMALSHKEPDRVPQLIRWGKEIGIKLSQIFGASGEDLGPRLGNDAIICQVGINAFMEMSVGDLPEGGTVKTEWGVVYERQSGFNNPVQFPLEHKEDLDHYRWPNPNDPHRLNEIQRVMEKYHDDYVVIVDLSSSLYEAAMAHLRGMEKFILDSYDDPIWVGRVLDGLTDYYITLGCHAVNAGVDLIRIGDDVGTQTGMLIPPLLWRELVKPRLKRMIRAYKKENPEIIILYHSCGDFSPIFDDLIGLGVGMISTMQPTAGLGDPFAIKKKYGEKLSFKGGLDTQHLLPQGTPDQVRAGVKELLKAYAPGGGYVFMPAHLLYQDVPIENIWAMMESLKDYGTYPLKI
jgi:uroporphyrinogen decarboxylase